jgi:glycosyltransferase involved in cell wall biosynthesis
MPVPSTSTNADNVASAFQLHPRQQSEWINVVAHLDPRFGGMSAVVPSLSASIRALGQHNVSLAAFLSPGESGTPQTVDGLAIHDFPLGYRDWLADKAEREAFRSLVNAASGLHIHGIWESSTLLAARSAQRFAKPYVISAHGMLQPWALRNKRWKKAIYGAILERSNLQRATCLHALTPTEAQEYRAYGLNNPIAVIPNGVNIPESTNADIFLNQFPQLRGKRLLLFLSRIHYKKGVDILCKAWKSIAKQWPDAHLVLAGPNFESTQSSIEAFIADAKLHDRVTLTGMLHDRLKWSALHAAECFLLPSYSEGLSVSVLEALGVGIPVIVTRQCNLPEVREYDCGWVIEPNSQDLEAALNDCLNSSKPAVYQMSLRGRALIREKFSWEVIGRQMSALYTWMQGGPAPTNVALDLGGKS